MKPSIAPRCAAASLSLSFRAVTFLSVFLLCHSFAWSQATSTSTVSGQVTDAQGAALPGAEIKLTDTATSGVLTTTSNNDGRYAVVNVPNGVYRITIVKQGFTTFEIKNQKVDIGTALTENASLQVGAVSTTVEVQATAAAELQTSSASVGTTMSNKDIEALPNLGRDTATLAVLQPGVTPGGYSAGAVQDQNTYTIDGGQNTDDMSGNTTSYNTNFTGLGGTQTGGASSGIVPTPVESIEEFKVTSFNQGADFNGGLGSQIQMVTKRGTNQFHGSAYGYYFATNVGASNSWTNNHTPSASNPLYTPLPSNHRDRFGASLGGPITTKNFVGGKWYFFYNYEGFRFPNANTYERPVPSALMRLGIIQLPNSAGTVQAYNLNPYSITYGGKTYAPAMCGTSLCDPRGIGISPVVSQIWNKQMPIGNDPTYTSNGGDGYNLIGYQSTIRTPLTTNTHVARIDHDFSDKFHFYSSYRYMNLQNLTNNQVDIGGALPGDSLGTPAATAPRDQIPSMITGGLTTTLSSTATNSFVFSYTRNFWQWGSVNAPVQIPGLGGAAEIAPGTASSTAEYTYSLIPYNVNTQNVRQRFWDGKDLQFKDDLTQVKGNHIIQYGGLWLRNNDYHMRTDNGVGVNNAVVYQIGSTGLNTTGFAFPAGVASTTNFQNLYAEVLGIVGQSQVAYTRSGSTLALQPIGSQAYEHSIIPSYNVYGSDSWHIKPSLTLTYGLAWALQMPPYELNGNQVVLVDNNGKPVTADSYLASRKSAALSGSTFNPTLGFETTKNLKMKYPYNPTYAQFSPRVALAWNPKFSSGLLASIFGDGKTVIRGGYGRIYGRVNGVNNVLTPLLGPGLIQAVSCLGATSAGTCGGTGTATPSTAFRLGPDGLVAPLPSATATLPQPFYPGINGAYAQDTDSLDPNYRPEVSDNFSFAIQRAIGTKSTLEIGFIGKLIRHETTEQNLDQVPYMTTLGSQTFANAYANTYWALNANAFATTSPVAVQPFYEAALGGTSSAYCKGFSSCTAAVVSKNASLFKNTQVSNLWKNLNSANGWVLGNTMIDTLQASSTSLTTSNGYGNYNALYVTYRMRDWHGLGAISNFTWGRALGTGATTQASSSYTVLDNWNLGANYGPQSYDYKFLYNLSMTYQVPFYQTQKGIVGHLLGGWTIAPLFTAASGAPNYVIYNEGGACSSQCQAFGESTSSGITASYSERAVGTGVPIVGGTSANYNNSGSNGVGTTNATGVNAFANPSAAAASFRPCILGYDTSCGGYGNIRGQSTFNLDGQVLKNIGIWKEGRVGATLSFQVTNVLNHVQLSDPNGTTNLSLSSLSTFGRINSQANTPRNMEFGLRIHF